MVVNPRDMGRPRGKLAGRVWTRASLSNTIYSYIPGIKPKWRTEAQLRTMRALASAPHAWRRLTPEQRRAWQENPPPVRLSGKNRGSNPAAASGWNRFVSRYIQEARPMIYLAARSPGPVNIPANTSHMVSALWLPPITPTNILLRYAFTATPETITQNPGIRAEVWSLTLPDTWTELHLSRTLYLLGTRAGISSLFRPTWTVLPIQLQLNLKAFDFPVIVTDAVFEVLY